MTEPSRGGARILVVDDDESVRDSTADILLSVGYVVTQASQSQEAAEQLSAEGADLIILDVGLGSDREHGPSRAGLDLLDQVEDLPPVILMSGSSLPPEADPRVAMFLPKPVAPKQLLEEVARLLRPLPPA